MAGLPSIPLPEIRQRLQVQGQVVNLVSQPKQRTLFNWKILLHTSGATCARYLSPLSVSNVGAYCKRTEIEIHDTSLLSTPKHMTSAKTEDSRYPALRLSKHWDFSRLSSRHTWKVPCANKICEKISRLGFLICLASTPNS